jgi:alkaline phosphatase D
MTTTLVEGFFGTIYYWIEVSNYSTFDRNYNNTIYPRLSISNTFNTYLSTSTLTPTTGTQLITKTYADSTYIDFTTDQTINATTLPKGIYSIVNYGDVDLFLTDDRYFRAEVDLLDSIDGKPNTEKTYFGIQQMNWLKNALLNSHATFKIIVTGSQVLNPLNKYECMMHYPYEYHQLLDFLAMQKIEGVLFLTGDRHHSEIVKMQRENTLYPLYDITVSPYTSGVSKVNGQELNNPFREPNTLVEAQNFAKISFSGKKKERVMKVEFLGTKGDKLGEWIMDERFLKIPKQ